MKKSLMSITLLVLGLSVVESLLIGWAVPA